ncbi:hypothetical protein METBIDRAFT_38006 [Metschnikowia bicuspidata var. bicuspidata NRRL YB-4993]|uniref:Zn(2)-C6 fungal-type domain-containing protein n=1 Tax=Metschnikowia bicuspidata var. bicuspidata NRRL YB-4993 TaxID=869754 RepID=A0A1A0HI24_9ASCO|nr:hypothetical protein METBIDRAFT_38006 [Metschnikowia bicuspidata var. bicuspidata NRRL YB-4993]OBA23532.1 hypothetical protein METBIDRAFT_38006 [Metschnikowia bicuspidata var. bicuspidata NRRL YB-4993]
MDDLPPKPPIVKRRYSRSGCRECKRRKIKCDEVHPTCGNCVRVDMVCVFPDPSTKNKPRQQRDRLRRPTSSISAPSLQILQHYELVQAQALISKSDVPSDLDMLLFENVFDEANTLVHGLANYETHVVAPAYTAMSPLLSERFADLKPFHSQIILNDSPKKNVFFDEKEFESYLQNTDVGSNPMLAQSWNAFSNSMRDSVAQDPRQEISNAQLMQTVIDTYKLSEDEQTYFRDMVSGQGCLYFFPFISNTTNNEVIHVLLEYLMVLKFMVYAMMALSASCLFTIKKDPKHEQNQKKYTRVCMRLIVRAFTDLKNNELSLWHIEGLILTVLILTMLFSDIWCGDTSQTPVSWVVHLDSARSLLIKYKSLKAQSSLHRPESLGIVIAKLLFFCYDWNTNMCLPIDAIKSDQLADLWAITGKFDAMIDDQDHIIALKKFGLMIPASKSNSAFNTFNALTPELIKIIYEILDTICHLNIGSYMGKPRQASPEAITNIMALINQALRQNVVPGVLSRNHYIILLDNPAHPLYLDVAHRIVLSDCAYGIDLHSSAQTHYSWCDVVVKLNVYFLYLKILTSRGLLHLPRSHPLIKALIEEIMGLMFFVKPKARGQFDSSHAFLASANFYLSNQLFDHRAIMLQFPFRLCIELTDLEVDFEKLELFFEGLILLGCGNCFAAAEKVRENRLVSKKRVLNKLSSEHPDMDYSTQIIDIY